MFQRPVFLGAHPDDICLGCGGLLSKLSKLETPFCCYIFADKGIERTREWERAMSSLTPLKTEIFSIKGDALPDNRYEIRGILEKIKDEFSPDAIFTHSLSSIHQSHCALAEEVERVMRNITVVGYSSGVKEGPYFVPRMFIELTDREMEDKLALIKIFKSQDLKHYMNPEVIRSISRIHGAQIGVRYAEAFDIVRIKW